jgi:hypothetical protein
MNITTNVAAPGLLASASANKAAEAKKEYRVKAEQHDIADRFEDSRELGNGVGGLVTGAAIETLTSTVMAPKLSWEIMENLWQADTLGPNIKFLGTLAAIPGAAANIAISPFVGGFKGARLAGKASRETEDVLPKDAAPEYTNKRFNGNSDDKSMTSKWIESLEELGSKKLEPGEKKFDIPVLSPVFSLVGGVVSGGITGVVGLVAGLGAGMLTTAKEAWAGITTGKIGRVIASPLHTVAIPYGLMKEGLKESVPRGFVDGWKHGPLKPIVDTTKASAALAGSVLKEAWER